MGVNTVAVLTADIVNSTRLSKTTERRLLTAIDKILTGHKYEFYRGDSFQVYINQPEMALRIALLCRSAARSLTTTKPSVQADIRISIGIGVAEKLITKPGMAKGEAFILSGRGFDEMVKQQARLSVNMNNSLAASGMAVIADYINSIYDQLTVRQAMVTVELLNGKNQQEIAVLLKKSKSTIHQHVQAARYNEIEKILYHFDNIIKLST